MSALWEVAVYLGHFCWYLAPGIIAVIILVALACYGFQMIRLFFQVLLDFMREEKYIMQRFVGYMY
jgi:divalent metal cation (Fe/Co/Zn/Cd) transporter